MAYLDKPLSVYLDDAASGQPTPGGGSVSALAGALAAAMGSMVGAFTLQGEKYQAAHALVGDLRVRLETARTQLTELLQTDVDEYAVVAAAYALPKGTPEEKAVRQTAIRAASWRALQPPLQMVRALGDVAACLPALAEKGNPNLISDVGVSAYLCRAACEGAALNVRVNLNFLKDDPRVADIRPELAKSVAQTLASCAAAAAMVDTALGA